MQEEKKEQVIDEKIEEVIKEEEKKETKDTKDTKDEEIAKLKLEINDWKKEYAIKLADFENYKKRMDKELQEYKKYACEPIIIKQVQMLDILSMAIESAKSTNDMNSLLEGLEMIKKGMIEFLTEEGLEEIEAENAKFDPYVHHAVQTVSNEDMEDDMIVQVLQKGYKLKNKVIRPAMVTINKK